MPDLDQDRVTAWLQKATLSHGDDLWPPPIREVEQTAATPVRLEAFGRCLDHAAATDVDALRQGICESALRDGLRSVLAQLGAARLLRVIHWLGQEVADHAATEALLAGDHPEANALRAAIDALIRQTTLCRLFDRSRIDALAAAVATARQEKN
ncbi:MAG: hypothetical protein JOZ15_19405 [Acidobacteria bacterium]|nr:hypothetical protein [Acidobacteriota bacterium]